jgi:ribosomal-protein-alanine N-acetyltransferase
MNFTPFPVLETERLLLRRIEKKDSEDFLSIRSDKEVMRYIPRPIPKCIDDIYPLIEMIDEFLIKGERINWGIEIKSSKLFVGVIGFVNLKEDHFRAELGYVLASKYQRKGIMTEALKAVVSYGFKNMNLHSIEAIVDSENLASNSLLINFGFQKEAYFREDFYFNSRFRNSIHYGLLSSDVISG